MTSSLVGSEMCIRDSLTREEILKHHEEVAEAKLAELKRWQDLNCFRPVSYTHLTLPTICSV
eukprot:6634089-Prorocentrum_lima.AAC.1